MNRRRLISLIAAVVVTGCASTGTQSVEPTATTTNAATTNAATPSVATSVATAPTTDSSTSSTFTAEVWVDNWFSLTVNGVLVGEDSVPITTERSFNAETLTFEATYPLTIAFVTMDYKQTESGLEYIGTDRQQMGDGGFVAQITDTATGVLVAATNTDWRGLAVQRAPLNQDCVSSADPNTDCQFEAIDEPAGWTEQSFDDSKWAGASAYTAMQVGTKEGYDTITWAPSAQLIWTSDLEVDNTILWRFVVTS